MYCLNTKLTIDSYISSPHGEAIDALSLEAASYFPNAPFPSISNSTCMSICFFSFYLITEMNHNNSSRDEVVVKQVSMVLPRITRWQQHTLSGFIWAC